MLSGWGRPRNGGVRGPGVLRTAWTAHFGRAPPPAPPAAPLVVLRAPGPCAVLVQSPGLVGSEWRSVSSACPDKAVSAHAPWSPPPPVTPSC